jgi:hypothetical protein
VFVGLTDDQLGALGLLALEEAAEGAAQDAIDQAARDALRQQTDRPPLESWQVFGLALAVIVSATLLLSLMVLALLKTGAAASGVAQALLGRQRLLVEGMVRVTVVVAVVILSISKTLTAEGSVSVLAAILGYAVGRVVGERAGKDVVEPTTGDTTQPGGGGSDPSEDAPAPAADETASADAPSSEPTAGTDDAANPEPAS